MRMLIASDARPAAGAAATAAPTTFRYKLLLNIAGPYLPYPIASDLWTAPAFQDLLNRTAAGQPTHWYRNFSEYTATPRPRYELYDLLADPAEANNLAADPTFAGILGTLKADLRAWQEATNDDWLIKYVHE